MRPIAISIMLLFSAVHAATPIKNHPPGLCEPAKDRICVFAGGHDFEEPGFYHTTSTSLAALLRDQIRLSRLIRDIRIQRKEGESVVMYRITVDELNAGKDFQLQHGDTLFIVCGII